MCSISSGTYLPALPELAPAIPVTIGQKLRRSRVNKESLSNLDNGRQKLLVSDTAELVYHSGF